MRIRPEDAELVSDVSATNPEFWMRHFLGFKPWPMQVRIAESVRDNRRTSVASCHGIGKSAIAARIAMWFLYCFPNSIVLTTAPTKRQVEAVLWKELRVAHTNARFPLAGQPLTTKLELGEDWWALGFTARDATSAFQGFHADYILVIVDEASGVSPRIYTEIEGVLSSAHARLLLIGNPTNPVGEFAASFHPKRKSVSKINVSAFDTPNFTELGITRDDIRTGKWKAKQDRRMRRHGELPYPALITPEWVADKWEKWALDGAMADNPEYIARVEGQFPQEGEDSLFPISLIEAAMQRELDPGIDAPSLGLDVARSAGVGDESVCYARQGDVFRLAFAVRTNNTMEVAGRVAKAYAEIGAGAVSVDCVGVGGPVGDRIREQGYNVIDVNFGSEPVNDTGIPDDPQHPDYSNHPKRRFANLKAQLYWRFRERLESGRADLDADDLDFAAQATSVKWGIDSKGRIAIEAKERLKKRGEKSPDRVEAAIYAAADTILDAGGFALV